MREEIRRKTREIEDFFYDYQNLSARGKEMVDRAIGNRLVSSMKKKAKESSVNTISDDRNS